MPESPPRLPSKSASLVDRQVGDFIVQRLIGTGGMGEVYLAEQISLRRPVALKVLRTELTGDDQYLRRFEAEAKAIAPITHPNIVSVFAIGQVDGLHYIAFEFVRGTNLRHYIDRRGPLDESVCLHIATRVTAALVRAAEAGIVHRDIKPENILITKRGDVKVADFGLARMSGQEDVRLTQTGMTMGTPLYMSPEQIQGQPIDIRSDIYSLGVVCHHMLAGEPPYKGETAMAVAIQHVHGEPVSLMESRPDVCPELLGVIARMMARKPEDRYASPAALLRDLERLKKGETHLVELLPGFEQTLRRDRAMIPSLTAMWRKLSTGPLRPLLVAGSILCAAAIGFGMTTATRSVLFRPPTQPPPLTGAPDITTIDTFEDGSLQYRHARDQLKGREQELGYWAVLVRHPGEEESTILAAQRLAEIYLPTRDLESLDRVADYLVARDQKTQKTFGYLLRGIALSRQLAATESEASFDQMLIAGRQARLDAQSREWIARQYFVAVHRNDEILSHPQGYQESARGRFYDTFPPRRGRERFGPPRQPDVEDSDFRRTPRP